MKAALRPRKSFLLRVFIELVLYIFTFFFIKNFENFEKIKNVAQAWDELAQLAYKALLLIFTYI